MKKLNLSILVLLVAITLYSCKNISQKQEVSTESVDIGMITVDSNRLNNESITQNVSGFFKNLTMGKVSFKVSCTDSGSLNKLTLVPSGIELKDVISVDVDGSITNAVIADINEDTFPEVYCFANSAGSGSYGKVYAYASNKNKSMSQIFLPDIIENKKLSNGYMGHDTFKIDQSRLVRSFPVYRKDDPNALPSGGTRTITYKLKQGETGWVLEVDNAKDLK